MGRLARGGMPGGGAAAFLGEAAAVWGGPWCVSDDVMFWSRRLEVEGGVKAFGVVGAMPLRNAGTAGFSTRVVDSNARSSKQKYRSRGLGSGARQRQGDIRNCDIP